MIDNFIAALYGIINTDFQNISNNKGRRALIYLLGDNSNAIVAADILIYLIYQTFTTPRDILEKYEGFIVRTYQQIEIDTGCSNLMKCRAPLNLLKSSGLIETNNKAHNRRTCYRVNTDLLIERLEEAYIQIGLEREKFYEEFNEKGKSKDTVEWENINEIVDRSKDSEEAFNELKSLSPVHIFDIPMMYYVDLYWKERFGTDYRWNRAEFNTLSLYLTSKGTHNLTSEELQKLKDSIFTLEEVEWMECKYPAVKIVKRYIGYKRFDNLSSDK